ncbi:MAG TPA: ATP-binding protein [Thermoanaerobaculia bacterium]|jgi:signal transduction histidine kinase
MTEDRSNAIRAELQAALTTSPVDVDEVLRLAFQLSALDPEAARFSVDAGHISRLGLELVAKQQTAVAELVKNAYDADAAEVRVTFSHSEAAGGTVEVWDNGIGMSRDELIDGFMRLSTAAKQEQPISPLFGRRRAGRKGIGRFAAQRLGERLIVVTQQEGADSALQIDIDWTKFKSGLELQAIRNRIDTVAPRGSRGTTLTVKSLRDAWTEDDIRASYQAILELVQPFPLGRKASAQGRKPDPGFYVTFLRDTDAEPIVVADPWTEYFQYALAEVTGTVDSHGKAVYRLRSERYDINDYIRPKEKFKLLSGVRFKAYYFIPTEVPKQVRATVTNRLRESGGVRVYRNGFRTLPYGEHHYDWLGLDTSARRRKILPPHANLNFLGFVELTDPTGERFEETSSREGLVENAPYRALQRFVFDGLIQLVLRVGSARGKKLQAGTRRDQRSPMEVAEQIIGSLPPGADASTAEQIRLLGAAGETLSRELRMMRILATLGLTLAEFTHEVALGFTALSADVGALREQVLVSAHGSHVAARLERQVASLRSYVDYFEETVRDNVSEEVRSIDLGDVIREFEELMAPRNERQDIDLDIAVKHHVLKVRPMHISELSSILTNLYSNAVKAIKTAGVSGAIQIAAWRERDVICLDFSDNGCGVKPAHRDLIFDAFFTTTNHHDVYSSEAQQVRGMGLGLKIVKDIVESAGGSISLAPPRARYSTTFHVELPEAR